MENTNTKPTNMESKVLFQTTTKDLLKVLKQARSVINPKSKTAFAISLELSLNGNKLTLAIPGAVLFIEGAGAGICRATTPFLRFYQIIADTKAAEIELCFAKDTIKIGPVSIYAQTVFEKESKRFRTIDLPVNYTDLDLIRLKRMKYKVEELIFNNLYDRVEKAMEDLELNLDKSFKLLKGYGFTREELERLINEKMGLKK